jgi:hypothetical protein
MEYASSLSIGTRLNRGAKEAGRFVAISGDECQRMQGTIVFARIGHT